LTRSLTFLALFSVSSKEHVVFEERKRERPRQREGGTNTGYASSQSSIVLHQSEGVAYLEEEHQQEEEEELEEDNWSNAMGALAFGSDDPRLSPGAVVGGGGGGVVVVIWAILRRPMTSCITTTTAVAVAVGPHSTTEGRRKVHCPRTNRPTC